MSLTISTYTNCFRVTNTDSRNEFFSNDLYQSFQASKSSDSFEQDHKDYKKNLEELKKNGGYIPAEKGFLKNKKAMYVYQADGYESLADIKKKFNLIDGAIKRCNPYLRDDNHSPERGKKIYFYEEDVKIE